MRDEMVVVARPSAEFGRTAEVRPDHATAAKQMKTALGKRESATVAERALRELIAAKGDVEYGTALITRHRADPLVRRARTLVDLAAQIVRLGA